MKEEIITAICDYLKKELPDSDYTIKIASGVALTHLVFTTLYVEITIDKDRVRTSSYCNHSYTLIEYFLICDPDLLPKIKSMIINKRLDLPPKAYSHSEDMIISKKFGN